MMNIQLKNLNEELLCKGIILKRKDTNEEWQARVSDLIEYKDMYVRDIYACDNNVILVIQKEPTDQVPKEHMILHWDIDYVS